ncbi:MAG: HprK-related kinase A [Pseudomonadota bacterium]
MKLSKLTDGEQRSRLHGAGLVICSGPFKFRIFSRITSVERGIRLLYADYAIGAEGEFVDFNITLQPSSGLHRWWRKQVNFSYNGYFPFKPLPLDHAYPLLEWAMNWCISTQAHHYLLLHSAVIERDGCAVILPAPPGSGKSTLCAGLVSRGWRLLSDELALISLTDRFITPLGRPISLKNQSVDVIGNFAPGSVFNQLTHDTTKGTVTHMKVPTEQLQRMDERAYPRWVIFPKYVPLAPTELTPRSKANSMLELARNSFNYIILGLTGFEVLSDVITDCDCYDFSYSSLDEAVEVFNSLVNARKQ